MHANWRRGDGGGGAEAAIIRFARGRADGSFGAVESTGYVYLIEYSQVSGLKIGTKVWVFTHPPQYLGECVGRVDIYMNLGQGAREKWCWADV